MRVRKDSTGAGRVFRQGILFAAGVFLAAGALLVLDGCRNTLIPSRGYIENPQNPGGAKPGTVRLEVLSGKQARTVMPDFGKNGGQPWVTLELDFKRTDGDSHYHTILKNGDEINVDLDAGWWILTAEAQNASEKIVARYEDPGFEVEPGKTTEIKIRLAPVMEGDPGTFRIEAGNAGGLDGAQITVTKFGRSSPEKQEELSGSPDGTMKWETGLPSGQYNAQLTMFFGGNRVVLSQVLHIYSNLESVWWLEDAGSVRSGETLFDAWNGSAWNFLDKGIDLWHLRHFDDLYEGTQDDPDLYDGFHSWLLSEDSGMDIGEIDRLFTGLSNSSGTKPEAGGYDYERFANLIDAALVARAVSHGTIVPDDLDSQSDVEAAFNGLLADEGNGTQIEFGWEDWAAGFSAGADPDFTLCLYVGSPRYRVEITKTRVDGKIILNGPGTIAKNTVYETEGLFSASIIGYPDIHDGFVFKTGPALPLPDIRLEYRDEPYDFAIVVGPKAVIPQDIEITVEWLHPTGGLQGTAKKSVTIVAEDSTLTAEPPSGPVQIFTDSRVTVKVHGTNLGPSRTVKFSDPGVLPSAGKDSDRLPEGVSAGGDFVIKDGVGEGELVLSGIPAFTNEKSRNIAVTVSLEALRISGSAGSSFTLELSDPPGAAVTKPDQANPVTVNIKQGGGTASLDFGTENLTASGGWNFAGNADGLPEGVTVVPGSVFTNSTDTGKGSGTLQLLAAIVPPGSTDRPLPVTAAFPGGLEGKFSLRVEPAGVSDIRVSPSIIENVRRGETVDFTATVDGYGYVNVPQDVKWTLSGAQNHTSAISEDGHLSIAPDEPNSALTVRATPAIDGGAYGEAEVRIPPTVTDVVVSPRAVIVDRGSSRTFTAEVKGYGDNISQEVVWFVSGSGDSRTRIDGSGKLTVANTDRATVITVKATSPLDSTDFPGSTVTVPVRGDIALGDWNSVATGVNHTLGLRHDGTLYAWGKNDWGQLGVDSTDKYKDRPVQVGTGDDWVAIAGGWSHSVGLKSDGTLWAWGRLYDKPANTNPTGLINDYGLKPVQIGTRSDWESISAGYNNAFAITKTGELYAWGNNGTGKLGIGSEESKKEPFQVGSTADWSLVSSGRDNTVATKKDGTLWVWGKGGEIFKDKQLAPMQIMPDVRWASAIVGNHFATALDTNGYLWTWGQDDNGALGNGSTVIKDPYTPEKIEPGKTWLSVSNAVSDSVFAIDSNGDLFAWGKNNPYNQLGIGGGGGKKESPVPVTAGGGPNKWMNVIVCAAFGLGVQEDGSLWAWGHNTFGQLGNGDHDPGLDTDPNFTNSEKNEPSPVQIKLN